MKFSLWTTAIIIMFVKTMVESISVLKEIITQRDSSLVRTANSQNGVFDFVELVKLHGYPVEEHQVVTEDGYVLIFYRIPDSPRSNSTQQNKPIAFLQHGAYTGSEVWVLLGPENSLAFLLADAGFDVWLGSLRGTLYGQFIRKSMSDKEFWRFSYHEHAIYDLPALIDYVLAYTKSEKLNYIGYSMGATMSYILLSTKPSYNAKFRLVLSLAPVAYWVKASVPPLIKLLLRTVMNLKPALEADGIYGVVPGSKLLRLSSKICSDKSILQLLCATIILSFFGNDPFQLSSVTIKKFTEHYPGGGSFQIAYHYIQNFNTEKFQAYDYGYEENIKRYNHKTPPEYDLKNITAPVAIIYGRNDALASIEGTRKLYKKLPNVSIFEAVPYQYFSHSDFILAKDVRKFLNDRITYLLKLS